MGTLSLTAPEVDRLREVVDLCRTPPEDARAASWAVLEALQALVGCDAVGLNGMDSSTRRHYYRQWYDDGELSVEEHLDDDETDRPFWRAYDECVSCSSTDRTPGFLMWSTEDYYTPAEWRENPMHREALPDVLDELVMAYPDGPSRTVRLLFPRQLAVPFGDREKVLLSLLQPHLATLVMAVRTPAPKGPQVLTARQLDVLGLVRLGLGNKQIARQMGLSPATVRKHLENAYQRLDVQSRAAAVHAAFDTDEQLPASVTVAQAAAR